MCDHIVNWLDGDRDYEAGVALYRQHGARPAIVQLLSHGSNRYTRQVLLRELQALVPIKPTTVRKLKQPAASAPVDPGALPANLQKHFDNNIVRQLKKRGSLHALLEDVSREERQVLAGKIMDITDAQPKLFAPIDYYRKHGHEQPPNTISGLEAMRRLHSMRMAKSRAEKKGNTERCHQITTNIEQLEQQLEKIVLPWADSL